MNNLEVAVNPHHLSIPPFYKNQIMEQKLKPIRYVITSKSESTNDVKQDVFTAFDEVIFFQYCLKVAKKNQLNNKKKYQDFKILSVTIYNPK